jgi:hypothetical protein
LNQSYFLKLYYFHSSFLALRVLRSGRLAHRLPPVPRAISIFGGKTMTPRSIRRAAERKANKLARKAAQHSAPAENLAIPTEQELADTQEKTSQPAIPDAAAANTRLSAVTSLLTGDATLLPTADATRYGQLLRDYQTEYQPVGLQESNLVQSLAETAWRTRRTLALEMAIFAKGRIEFAEQFAAHKPELRESLIDVHTFLTYEKQIRGLQLQEARLSRRTDKQSTELRSLQQERGQRQEHARRAQEEEYQRQLEAAAQLYQAAQQNQQPFDPEANGFEFSNQEIESYLAQKQTRNQHFSAPSSLRMRAEAA